MHTVLQDRRIDRDITEHASIRGTDLLGNVLLTDGLGLLCELAGGDLRFWAAARAAFEQLASAYAAEPTLGRAFADRADARVRELIAGRAATVRVLVAALACRTGRHDRVEAVQRALDRLVVAMEIRDGISDWREDHARGKQTFALLRLAERIGKDLAGCTPDELADALYLDGGVAALVDEILEYLRDASAQVSEYPHQRLAGYVAELAAESRALADGVRSRQPAGVSGQLPPQFAGG